MNASATIVSLSVVSTSETALLYRRRRTAQEEADLADLAAAKCELLDTLGQKLGVSPATIVTNGLYWARARAAELDGCADGRVRFDAATLSPEAARAVRDGVSRLFFDCGAALATGSEGDAIASDLVVAVFDALARVGLTFDDPRVCAGSVAPRVYVHVQGGNVQEVRANAPVDVTLIDDDHFAACESRDGSHAPECEDHTAADVAERRSALAAYADLPTYF